MADTVEASDGLRASNHRIKRLRRLLSSRKARSEERAFVVEGPSLVTEALTILAANEGDQESELSIEGLYLPVGDADDDATTEAGTERLAERARELGVAVHFTARGVLPSVLDTVNPQAVAAVVSRRPAVLADLDRSGAIALLVEVRDPGNTGTLLRTAEASGAAGVILAGTAVDPTNPKVVRASAGAVLRLPVVIAPDVDSLLDDLVTAGRSIVATVIDDAIPYDQVELGDAVIALGNEAGGLSDDVIDRADIRTTIPQAGPTESLNVAAAGAVLLFEALRQRRTERPPPR